jgi:4-amino-4-deoxy-L-arabinose transferase-like glycosyltransferase
MNNKLLANNILIALAAMLLFVPFLGAVHLFDWDEINFAECAREMIETKNYLSVTINYHPFWEKPPLFIWMQALSMNIFGINEFAARLPNAICGVVTLLVLFNIGRQLVDTKFGLLWVLVYAGSFLPNFYFKSGIIDPWFNFFIFCSIHYFILFHNSKNEKKLILSAVFIAFAILTKGPVAVLILALCIVILYFLNRKTPMLTTKQIFIFCSSAAAIGSVWFLMLLFSGNSGIIKEFFLYQIRLFNTQDSGHGGSFFYHWIVILIGCFPLSIIALSGFRKFTSDTPFQLLYKKWMLVLFWVVLILFSVVKTKIVHYSSLCYFPLSFLASYVLYKIIAGEMQLKKYQTYLLLIVGIIIGAAISVLPLIDKFKQTIIDAAIINDAFAIENLKTAVHWSGYEGMIGLLFLCGVISMVFLYIKNKEPKLLIVLFFISLFTINITSIIIVPKIEKYSQSAAIDFYEYISERDCYVETFGFKSYAHLFYTKKKSLATEQQYDINWLLRGNIDKPTYIVAKLDSEEEISKDYKELHKIYAKGGFIFYERFPKTP